MLVVVLCRGSPRPGGHCHNMKDAWEKAATSLKGLRSSRRGLLNNSAGLVRFGAIDASKHRSTSDQYNVGAFTHFGSGTFNLTTLLVCRFGVILRFYFSHVVRNTPLLLNTQALEPPRMDLLQFSPQLPPNLIAEPCHLGQPKKCPLRSLW